LDTRRARGAIDELRRALPGAIAEFEKSVAEPFRIDFTSPVVAEHLRAIQDLPRATTRCEILKEVLALLNSLPPRPSQRAKAWWRLDASKLCEIYRTTIGVSAGIALMDPRSALSKRRLDGWVTVVFPSILRVRFTIPSIGATNSYFEGSTT
jgi:hypothetical protein